MLEKIGLPPKPSLRGNNWVVDASHCQGCSSQFTFLNRKHHCRRCGGLFCNSCTLQRMVLRGQGDSPVRICEPCKKLEDSARFELRHGHRNRSGKGSSKVASRSVDDVLNQILPNDGKEPLRLESGKEIDNQDEDTSMLGNASNDVQSEIGTASPEELRQKSLDEKMKYKVLKGEGKSAEALRAFKRAKELERQAAALELQSRKNRRKALAFSSMAETRKSEEPSPEAGRRDQPMPQKDKEKDDLTAELRELGWSDVDIHDAEVKPATTSLEGELLSLVGHDSRKHSHGKVSSGTDKTQVVALKKKAILLKREGKLSEAKEELKRAKILEKQLEEQDFLADADDSDDELSALIRSLDNDKQNAFSVEFNLDSAFDLTSISGYGGDHGIDVKFEVTDDDMHDPEIAAALQSLGWTEEAVDLGDSELQSASVDREALADEILKLKKEAVNQKRSGNMEEAMSLLKKAKILEKNLDGLGAVNMAALDSIGSHNTEKTSEVNRMNAGTANTPAIVNNKPPKSRLMIQKELLALKKAALALRRVGKLEEADEELKKGKVLEQQLEEMNSASKMDSNMNVSSVTPDTANRHVDLSSTFAPVDEEGEVTDQDLHDPAYLSLLKNLGWQDEDNVKSMFSAEDSQRKADSAVGNKDISSASGTVVKTRRSRAEIQRELLGLKRKVLALRRQGHEIEAEEVLATAKALEEQLAEMEAPKKEALVNFEPMAEVDAKKQENLPEIPDPMERKTDQTPLKRPAEADDSEKRQAVTTTTLEDSLSPSVSPDGKKSPLQQEILSHKRKALSLKREGKLSEAREELRKAKLLERSLEEDKPDNSSGLVAMETSSSSVYYTVKEDRNLSTSTLQEEQNPRHLAPKPMSGHDRFKLQRECLSHKRNALKLRREGRTEEAEAELELAKKIEAQLEEVSPLNPAAPTSSEVRPAEDSGVEDLFDPQLLSALRAIGLQDAHVDSPAPVKTELLTSSSNKNNTCSQERDQLEAQIKAEKMKALNLKRAGKQAEALDALRCAKQMEKKLNLLPL